MKGTIVLVGTTYDKLTEIANRYGVSTMTVHAWRRKGWLGDPLLLGKTKFYDRAVLEAHLAAQKDQPHEVHAI